MKILFIQVGGVLARLFTKDVVADGGTVTSEAGTRNGLNGTQGASIVCPCSAFKVGKIYIWEF